MLSQAFEEGANRLDMRYRIRIEHNDIAEVSRHLGQVLNHLIDYLDEPPRRSAATLGHDEPLMEARGCAERCKWDGILMRLYLVERGHQVEQGGNALPGPKESRTWSTWGIGSWLRLLI